MKGKKFKKTLLRILPLLLIPIGVSAYFESKLNRGSVDAVMVHEHVWLLNENDEATGYLVVGEKQAALIDAMNGYQDLSQTVRAITKLPVIVLNTHGHSDHVWGDGYFGAARLNKADWDIGYRSYKNLLYKYIEIRNRMKDVRFTELREGERFDLGGVTLTAYGLPGHTPGSMCFLDREDRILFTGDSVNRHCWIQLAESLPVADFAENLEALSAIRSDYDFICHGHAAQMEEASLYDELLEAVKELRDGRTSMDTTYRYWGGTCMQHPFPSGNGVIVYKERQD